MKSSHLVYLLVILFLGSASQVCARMIRTRQPRYSVFNDNQRQPIPSPLDENSYSNLEEMTTTHFHLDLDMDFTSNTINGLQTLSVTSLIDNVSYLDLDIDGIQIIEVKEATLGYLPFEIVMPKLLVTGEQLRIYLTESNSPKNTNFTFSISYTVTSPTASSWLTPEQTASKTLPYLYTQCESTYCRSLAPFQDSPVVKSTYSANITVADPVKVYLSANQTNQHAHPSRANHTIYSYACDIPIPSYLFTIVAGNLVERHLGARTSVISEPTYIDYYANELSDLELYLTTVEEYTTPYEWGAYKIVIMPPSFPFGGMENPLVTFASPSIIAGDKSGISVAIHEIAHSWTGNLVTCKNWRNTWLNEGLTVYLQRQTDLILFGEDFFLIDSTVGNSSMVDAMNDYGMTSNYTSLDPYVKGTNPDDSFSEVQYEKGYQFMMYLESLFGRDSIQNFLRSYIYTFRYKSVDHREFRNSFERYFLSVNSTLANIELYLQIDWKEWIDGVGLPPVTMDFYTPLVSEAKDLADQFIALNGNSSPSNNDLFKTLTLDGQCIFLQQLFINLDLLNDRIIRRIESEYNLSNSSNMELLWRWYRTTIPTGYTDNFSQIHTFLGSIGREKMIFPIYQTLQNSGMRDIALQFFNEYQSFYHPIVAQDIEQLLQ